MKPKMGKNTPPALTDGARAKLERRLEAAEPKTVEQQELVSELTGLIETFTQQVKAAAEKRGIEVDVFVQISPKQP